MVKINQKTTQCISFFLLSSLIALVSSCNSSKSKAYVPESNGNINSLTVVMDQKYWSGELGSQVREAFSAPYEGLPFDEPKYDIYYIPPKAFSGFARNSRNIIVFSKDTIDKFSLVKNPWARPQVVSLISGEDQDVMRFFLEENQDLILRTYGENERIEKLRRISKSTNQEKDLEEKFQISLTYPSVYSTVKDTTNFLWIEKEVLKGHLNLIFYTLPLDIDLGVLQKRIPIIRDGS